jgi:glycosyltransferase involved in cell wall biosynthesis
VKANQVRARVSIVVPALNEEHNLRPAVAGIIQAADALGDVAIEILIVNDGSTDGTRAVVADLEAQHPCVRGIHHETNRGFGACFLTGLENASYERITLFPGDNAVSIATLKNMLQHCDKADVLCAYTINTECRKRSRSVLSAVYSFVYTATFNIHLRYINSTPVYLVSQLRGMKVRCLRYSFPSETTVRLLRRGCTFIEIQGFMNPGAQKSSALRILNLVEAVYSFLVLVQDIYITNREEFANTPVRVIPDESKLESVQPKPQHAGAFN